MFISFAENKTILSPKVTILSPKSTFWDKSKKLLHFCLSRYISVKLCMELVFWQRILAQWIKIMKKNYKVQFRSTSFCSRFWMDLRYQTFTNLDLRYGLKICNYKGLDLRYFKLDLRYHGLDLSYHGLDIRYFEFFKWNLRFFKWDLR